MNDPASNWGAAVAEASGRLRTAGFDQANRDARVLLAHVLQVTPDKVFAWPENDVTSDQVLNLTALTDRRLAHEPLSRILGHREFWSLSFQLSPDTLDPRPDSEAVIEAVLAHRPDQKQALRILDLGTGTGCLLAALLSEYTRASGVAVDLSEGAVLTARQNISDLGFANRAEVRQCSWDDGLEGQFDLIVSNPPYIVDQEVPELDRAVVDYDPVLALAGGRDGLDAYRKLAEILPRRLQKGGLAVLEFGHGQDTDIAAILATNSVKVVDWKEDLAGRRRCVVCR